MSVLLRNSNLFAVHALTLMVTGVPDEVIIQHIEGLEQQEVELHFATVQGQGSELLVGYELRYNAFGNPHHDVAQARVPLRRLQTEDTSLDDMFN